MLIDAGVGNASHLDAIAAAAPRGPSLVLVTHAHSDHVSGAPAIHARWPRRDVHEIPVAGSRSGCGLAAGSTDGAIVETDDGPLAVLHTPGHSPDHLTLWHAESRTLFVGDMLVQGSTVVIPASHGGSLAEYLRSLERMLQLNPARALPAHGPVIDDPAALIHHYVEHRAEREAQVLEALAAGESTVDAITAKIYPVAHRRAGADGARERAGAFAEARKRAQGVARRRSLGLIASSVTVMYTSGTWTRLSTSSTSIAIATSTR